MSLASTTGLSSGIDYNSIITQLRQVNSAPIALLNQKGQKLQTTGQALTVIQKAVQTFSAAADALSDGASFQSLTSTTSDRTILTASAGQTASPGSYGVLVSQLAKAGRIASQGVDTLNNTSIAEADGTFSFRIGSGSTVSIAVQAGMTLQDLADAINNQSDPGLRASVINDGTATNPYRLVLTSLETGAASKITILNNDTTLNLSSTTIEAAVAGSDNAFDGTVTSSGTYTGVKTRNILFQITSAGGVGTAKFKASVDGGLTWSADDAYTTSASPVAIGGGEGVNVAFGAGTADFSVGDQFSIDAFAPVLQTASDAIIEVDGIQVNRSTNTFSDVIEGVTLNAQKVSDTVQTVTVAANTSGTISNINGFVKAYNELVDAITALTKYDVDKQTAAPLFGDSSVNNIRATLRSIVTGSVPGLKSVNNLSAIGITIGSDGKLQVDSGKLNDAMDDDPEAVSRLFVESGRSSSSAVKFIGSSKETTTGNYQVTVTQAATQAAITGSETLGAGGLAAEERLTIVYGSAQTAVLTLTAGSTIDEIVSNINGALTANGLAAIASNDGGRLKINTTAYGSTETLRVTSDRAAGAGQLGIGTTPLTATGNDVVATINGVTVTGEGQTLRGPTRSTIDGLQLRITATAPTTATIALTRGIAIQLQQQMEFLNDSTDGLFVTRNKSLQDQIKGIEERIQTMTDRLDQQDEALRKRFSSLEARLSQLQNQGNFLLTQLASLIDSGS